MTLYQSSTVTVTIYFLDNGAALESTFFDMEVDMENSMCRDLVCLDSKAERRKYASILNPLYNSMTQLQHVTY